MNDYFSSFDVHLTEVIDSIKKMLYTRHPDIFNRLDFDQDEIYLEPLLYTYLSQKDEKWLDCIIYGYETKRSAEIKVFTNGEGIIYLPVVGYFKTAVPNQELILQTKDSEVHLLLNNGELPFTFEPILQASSGMEIVRYLHPLLETVFLSQGGFEVSIHDVYKTHIGPIDQGLEIIRLHNSEFYDALLKNVKKLMLFTSEKQESFAVFAAHNMIFLNIRICDSSVFFADHISHEGSHILFYTLTYKSKHQLFTCPYDTAFAQVTGSAVDHGVIYLRFHGLFTYLGITQTLFNYIHTPRINPAFILEAKGRFIFHMIRFKFLLEIFDHLNVFRPEGELWMARFREQYQKMLPLWEKLNPLYNIRNQPYDFNSTLFIETNAGLLGADA